MTEPIFTELLATWPGKPNPPKGITMSLANIEKEIRDGIEAAAARARQVLDEALPKLAGVAEDVEKSPLVQLALEYAGKLDPAVEKLAVDMLVLIAGRSMPATDPGAPAGQEVPVTQ